MEVLYGSVPCHSSSDREGGLSTAQLGRFADQPDYLGLAAALIAPMSVKAGLLLREQRGAHDSILRTGLVRGLPTSRSVDKAVLIFVDGLKN